MKLRIGRNRIPIATSLPIEPAGITIGQNGRSHKTRLLYISGLSVLIAIVISFIAKLLVSLISFTTQVFFFGNISVKEVSPATNQLGWVVIIIPAIGGIIVGLMALYGSKAIRGHGIPEAMEQVLTNDSKIRPSITYLKPVSAAVAIGAGGPFGAEGPIIATGGALGSTFGQLLKITSNERKILLAAGATAGMSAIFGSPVAAIFLAVELLLFEFSPRSIIPVALACVTGAAGHHFLFESGPVFEVKNFIEAPSNTALLFYSAIGIIIGVLSVGVTKLVYLVEDLFEKLPIHWMWWPAIGGLFVGLIGYFAPRTLGVGYENITDILNGHFTVHVILVLCVMKFCSWAIALGSGTSGGTLAPLLTIGSAAGALLGFLVIQLFPTAGVTVGLAALVGMATMFSGASRALFTSIAFALETTGQFNALIPLPAACTAAYFISYLLMENTIMTEKISRRGVHTPVSYAPDALQGIKVRDVMTQDYSLVYNRSLIEKQPGNSDSASVNFNTAANDSKAIFVADESNHIDATVYVNANDKISTALDLIIANNLDFLPVVSSERVIQGVISHRSLVDAHRLQLQKETKNSVTISLRRQRLRMLVKSKRLLSSES